MGLFQSKERIHKILEKSASNVNINLIENTNPKIEYKYKQDDGMDTEENETNNSISDNCDDLNNDSFRFSGC